MPKKLGNKTSQELYVEFQKKPHEDGFISFAIKVIQELEAAGRPVAYHYRAAIRSFLRFTKGEEVAFDNLNSSLIGQYDKWLTNEGVIRNTAASYLRTLQTIYNKGVKGGVIEGNDKSPFADVNTGIQKATERKALTFDELAIIKNADFSTNPMLNYTRDMFMFSVYMHGMSMYDMARLKNDNIQDGVISYVTKTAKATLVTTTIRLSKSISDIIERYNKAGQPYIFPIATQEEGSREFRNEVKYATRSVNRYLKTIASLLSIKKSVTMLSAWDTWHDLVETNDIIGVLLEQGDNGRRGKTKRASEKTVKAKPHKRDERWQKNYRAYINFINKNARPILTTDNSKLYPWLLQQKKVYKEGKMPEKRTKLFKSLLEKIEEVRKLWEEKVRAERDKAKKHKEEQNTTERLQKQETHKIARKERARKEQKEAKRKKAILDRRLKSDAPIAQDDLWNRKWKAYKDYLAKYGHRPSKYKPEDMVLYDWFKHSRKLYKCGLMKPDRVEKFQQLIDEAERVQRINQYSYVDRSLSPSEEKPKATRESPKRKEKNGARARKSSKWDEKWKTKYELYVKYLQGHRKAPTFSTKDKESLALHSWFTYNRNLYNNGNLDDKKTSAFAKLLPGGELYTKFVGNIDGDKADGKESHVEPAPRPNDVILKSEKTPSARKDKAIQLYDYQQGMKERIESAFKTYNSVMVQMPTGTGKTHVVAAVVSDFLQRDDNGKVWVVAHRRELVKQMRQTLALYLSKGNMKQVLATSIQGLTKHHTETKEKPILIVIDEAHHAVAKTYASVLNAYPSAKKLGVTATPYRLSGESFKDLFDTLLTSWGIRTFIDQKRLCSYDYYDIDNDSKEMEKIRDLKKRGADGDYQTKELELNFNDRLSIQRLYAAYSKYAQGKHGFVYAISIAHAENIAEFYRSQGVNAVAVSSRTPEKVRDKIMSDFKDGNITILVSVDLISEGFDAPDAELIQIARPTLSLAKYLQMVGRGLRTAEGKQYCIIIDNVGLIDRFGLPDRERDWNRYFNGIDKGGSLADGSMYQSLVGDFVKSDVKRKDDDMHLAFSHAQMSEELGFIKGLHVEMDEKGRKGLFDSKGNTLLEQRYANINISPEGIVRATILHGRVDWYDVINGITYSQKPIIDYMGDIPMAIVDKFFYPRIRSIWINQRTRISYSNMSNLYSAGLTWTNLWRKEIQFGQDTYFIPWHGTPKIYKIESDWNFGTRRLVDEEGNLYLQKNPDSEIVAVKNKREANEIVKEWKSEFDQFEERAKVYPISYVKVSNLPSCGYTLEKEEGSIIEATSPDGKKFWVDNITRRKFNTKPKAARKGKARILLIDDFVFIRSNEQQYPVQYWQIQIDNEGDYWIIGDYKYGSLGDWHISKTRWWWEKD